MKKIIFFISILVLSASLKAQVPPPPPLQPGEHWTNLYSVSYDFQTNGSVRYLVQDPANPAKWCAILMAQQDSNTALGVQRYIYYAYSTDTGNTWSPNVLSTSNSFGFPCLSLKNGIPVIACHRNSILGSFVFKDSVFGAFDFEQIVGVPVPPSTAPIWPHICGTTNGNLVIAASNNDLFMELGSRTTYNGSSWSSYVNMPLISGPSGNFEVAAGPNGKVSIIGTDYDGESELAWYRSNDNGVTFDAGTVIVPYILDAGDTLFANVLGGYQSVYDTNGDVHIIFAAYNYRGERFTGGITLEFVKPRIYHWSSQTNTLTQVAGRSNIPNLADTITQTNKEPLCHPTISRTSSGKLICAFTTYLRGNTQVVQNGTVVNTGEIFHSFSNDNGVSWSVPQNITNTPAIEEVQP